MKLLFVRHALALSRVSWLRDDMERPLSDKGIINAKKFFKELSKIYDTPDVIFCSDAVRAKETAHIFAKSFKGSRLLQTSLLNPGASFDDFKKLFDEQHYESVAIVGHEPDLSQIIGEIVAPGAHFSLEFKKSGVVEVEMDEEFRGVLKAVIPPKLFS
ncbi:MAG: histidine phosphatase family protein [Campylobacteraceae bacterium]|jgi:phosphohistidine phosphatase|nr:histidine phosphatase family protein [Campylobacteraceae bacterium]